MDAAINVYYDNLIQQLSKKKKNAMNQKGKSDIETANYNETISNWYDVLINMIKCDPPLYHVKSIIVNQNSDRKILSKDYEYYNITDKINGISLVINVL